MPTGPKGKLALPDSSIAKIAKLRVQSGAKDDSEVITRASRLYERLIKAAAEMGIPFPQKSNN